MKPILIVGCVVLFALLSWALVAGADREDDDREYSGLLEGDE